MSAEIDHAAGVEVLTNDAQDTSITEGCITGDVFDVEGGIESGKLEELSSERGLLTGTGGGEVIGQGDVEAASGIGEEERETGVTIAGHALVGMPFPIL
jgi:hypothetical protein